MGVDKDPHLMAWNQAKSLVRDQGFAIIFELEDDDRWLVTLSKEGGTQNKFFRNKSLNAAIKKAGKWARGL